jgi:hypothetical protein
LSTDYGGFAKAAVTRQLPSARTREPRRVCGFSRIFARRSPDFRKLHAGRLLDDVGEFYEWNLQIGGKSSSQTAFSGSAQAN